VNVVDMTFSGGVGRRLRTATLMPRHWLRSFLVFGGEVATLVYGGAPTKADCSTTFVS
jgi:hypothetical protein